jgi:hypothetical protein
MQRHNDVQRRSPAMAGSSPSRLAARLVGIEGAAARYGPGFRRPNLAAHGRNRSVVVDFARQEFSVAHVRGGSWQFVVNLRHAHAYAASLPRVC